MKPRIFISSTFYDLKTIREELYRFIRQYNYEPIESEAGDIGYIPGRALDESCYKAMSDCDMAILIIGGRYGSPASNESDDNGEYLSVTHKEFRTAVNNGIPVYAFIEQGVIAEYELYKLNKERFEDSKYEFKFGSVDGISVFKFIAELKSISGIPTISFAKAQDIESFLSIQWADMFKNYLESLRKSSANKKMTDSVEQMKVLMDKMDVMLDTVGKKILTADNSNEYESVIERQKILAICADLVNSLQLLPDEYVEDGEERKQYIEKLIDVLLESINTDVWEKYQSDDYERFKEFFIYFDSMNINIRCSDDRLCDRIEKNIDVFLDVKLKQLLINEVVKDKNYQRLFDEIED